MGKKKQPEIITLPIEHGALTEVPVYEDHKRGKNWLATIQIDPKSPGGLARVFIDRARGDSFFYIVDSWAEPGVAVEFGADYYTGSYRKNSCRWYGVIANVTADTLTLVKSRGPKTACKDAAKMKAPDPLADPFNLRKIPTPALEAELERRQSLPQDQSQIWT